jgi:hypothetical protein
MVDSLMGVDDQPVAHVSNNGLVAAVSRITREDLKPDMSLIMAYKKVVDSFHREQTIIPMRYGCLLKEKKQVSQLLEKNRIQYESLLKKLDGCVEMGIRVLIDDCRLTIEDLKNSELENYDPQSATESSEIQNPCPPSRALRRGGRAKSKMLGRAYLTSRKAHYAQEDKLGKEIDTIIEQHRNAFSGLYVKFKAEYPSTGNLQFSIFNHQFQIPNPLVSLYFLVPRQSVEHFRRVFRRICRGQSAKALLSGPWPPYNFVTHCSGKDTLQDRLLTIED